MIFRARRTLETLAPDEAGVHQHAADRQDHLAVDVVLYVLMGLVADADGAVATVTLQVIEDRLVQIGLTVDRVERLQVVAVIPADVVQVRKEVLHLLRVAQALEGIEREIRVAEPAVAVVPAPSGARVLGETRRRRRDDGSGVLELVQLQHERGANYVFLVVAWDSRTLYPTPPVVGGPREKAVCGLLQRRLQGRPPGEDQMGIAHQHEGAIVDDVRQRNVGRQPHRRIQSLVLDVVARGIRRGRLPPVVANRVAAHAHKGISLERPQNPDDHRGLEVAIVEVESRSKIQKLERARRRSEHGAQNVGVLDVLLLHGERVRRLHVEGSPFFCIEKGSKDEAAVHARPAEPGDRTVLEQRAVRAVAYDAVSHDRRRRR
jgi:hypothetical protein